MRSKAGEAVLLFRLLSDENRYLILSLLVKYRSGLFVREIAEFLTMSHSAVSHQLGALVASGIVTFTKEGRQVRYSIARSREAGLLRRAIRAFR